jgi:isoaspartyl peptidase/L-asparaginase-like protein (Ntn-hydrolase superfamily)
MAVLAIHGGCGIMVRSGMSEADWADARLALARSLRAGWAVLAGGGSAVDAVEAAVVVMEDSPHFNAGYGAALNAEGFHELDATIMDGASLKAGAVAIAQGIRNPVKVARLIMDKGEAVIVGGKAADEYASRHGLEVVDNSYFTTERRVRALAAMKEHGRRGTLAAASESEKHGTVGAVALDAAGNLAAATSTGGYNNKPKGRNLCAQWRLCRVRHRTRRIFHHPCGRTSSCMPRFLPRREPARSRRESNRWRPQGAWCRGRADRGRRERKRHGLLQHKRHVQGLGGR